MNEEACELSSVQLDKLMQYQEVTGVEDVSFAKLELAHHDWNVEAAVQSHLSDQESSHVSQQENLGPRSQSSSDSADMNTSDQRMELHRRFGRIFSIFPTRAVIGIFGWCYYLLTKPMRLIVSFIYRLIIPYPRRADPVSDILNFIREYEVDYGTQHPSFYRGSYTQALNNAKIELKFLLVYLHCKDNQDVPLFCSDVLSNTEIIGYINANVIFWGCSITSAEGYRVSQALRENGYPFLALIVLKDNKMTVVGRFEGPQDATTFWPKLQNIIQDNEAHLVLARADRQEREMNAALRQEQDAAYLESLRVDQEKARKRQEERDAQSKQLHEEREQQRNIMEERERTRRLKVEWVDRINQEPEEGEGVIHIVAKLPQGTRLNRRFNAKDSLTALYYYIFCHPDSPDRFQVTSNFPRRFVPCEPINGEPVATTFEDFGLPQRSMLFVTDLDA